MFGKKKKIAVILWLSISTLITFRPGPFEGTLAKEKHLVMIVNKCKVNGCLPTHKKIGPTL